MSQPVELSDELVLDARLTAEAAERSIAGQIEFWAQLGRAVEPLLDGARVLALRRAGAVRPLSACLAEVDYPTTPLRRAGPVPGRPGRGKIDRRLTRSHCRSPLYDAASPPLADPTDRLGTASWGDVALKTQVVVDACLQFAASEGRIIEIGAPKGIGE